MLFADESDTEDAPAVGLVETSNIPSSSKQPPSAPSRRTKQTERMSTGGRKEVDKQVQPTVAQIFRLDKRDLKKLEGIMQQDSNVSQ